MWFVYIFWGVGGPACKITATNERRKRERGRENRARADESGGPESREEEALVLCPREG